MPKQDLLRLYSHVVHDRVRLENAKQVWHVWFTAPEFKGSWLQAFSSVQSNAISPPLVTFPLLRKKCSFNCSSCKKSYKIIIIILIYILHNNCCRMMSYRTDLPSSYSRPEKTKANMHKIILNTHANSNHNQHAFCENENQWNCQIYVMNMRTHTHTHLSFCVAWLARWQR